MVDDKYRERKENVLWQSQGESALFVVETVQ
jgi:hypothetical protein